MDVDAAQVLAFRLAAHGLTHGRGDDPDPLAPLAGWGVQDSPPGAATGALLTRAHAKHPLAVDALTDAIADRSVVALYNARTATAVVGAADVAAFATALRPTDDDTELKALVGSTLPESSGDHAGPVATAVDAISDVLDGTTLSRDDLHEALRGRLPKALLPWCAGCKSHHARRGLLVMAALNGRLCLEGRAGRQPRFARTDQTVAWRPPADEDDARAELVRRYLRLYGPSTRQDFAAWAGVGTAQGKRLWTLVDDESRDDVTVSGVARGGGRRILEADTRRLAQPRDASGVHLLTPGDPLLLARDRDVLLDDRDAAKRVWKAIGGAGLVLVDGRVAALWRGRKQGRRLDVTVDPLPRAGRLPLTKLAAVADALAPHRGCDGAAVTVS
ncbi:hypothetical protein DSM112329_04802 [Paraconexibacter sp. AEG42_29]|uniref:Winged helix DNA-binding domain-containing protein n=1 Tax=Paraconexibacter sp. AEG42_29 TaxID=2997339 RepID=A0AAU7B1Z7_9ACTN